jgi:hypothetical protein
MQLSPTDRRQCRWQAQAEAEAAMLAQSDHEPRHSAGFV